MIQKRSFCHKNEINHRKSAKKVDFFLHKALKPHFNDLYFVLSEVDSVLEKH